MGEKKLLPQSHLVRWIEDGKRLKLGQERSFLDGGDSGGNLPFSPSPSLPSGYEVVKG